MMLRQAALLVGLLCVGRVAAQSNDLQQALANPLRAFTSWAKQHKKPYLDDKLEFAKRFNIWSQNLQAIHRHNTQQAASNTPSRATRGLTSFTDLTHQEFRAIYLGAPMQPHTLTRNTPPQGPKSAANGGGGGGGAGPLQWRYENVSAPTTVDWRQAQPGVLGPIKDQHVNGTPCGSCWAFSSVSMMEIASAMATGKVVAASEQHLIDCDKKYDHGCSGGGWLNAIQYTIKNKGLAREDEYPYTGKDGKCDKKLAKKKHFVYVDSWEDVPGDDESAMAQAVSQTPIITAICVGPALDDWHHYTGGIYDSPCCEKEHEITLDHGIVIVGYGEEGGVPYWLLKNSWGTAWGEQGFMRIKRNHGKHGKCAMAMVPAMVFRKPNPKPLPTAIAAEAPEVVVS